MTGKHTFSSTWNNTIRLSLKEIIMAKEAIPTQRRGAHFDVHESLTLESRDLAKREYEHALLRLNDINSWGQYAGESEDSFILCDTLGNAVQRSALKGDHIKIHLPGPRSTHADGADWVRIENIQEDRNKLLDEVFTALTVRPCVNPRLGGKETAHFYERGSSNTFIVCRHKTELICSVHGRNEETNLATDLLEVVRNLMVALPAKAGLSNPHWKRLASGLLKGKK